MKKLAILIMFALTMSVSSCGFSNLSDEEAYNLGYGIGRMLSNQALGMRGLIKERLVRTLPLFYTVLSFLVFSCTSVFDKLESNMVVVPAGDFLMGSESKDSDPDESPVHGVFVNSFKLCRYEVTQELWKAVMGSNPSYHRSAKQPVEAITYYEAEEFVRKLNDKTGRSYRLPTEQEWEYAAWLGTNGIDDLTSISWFFTNSSKKSHTVGELNPDRLGIYDILGNVNEWVSGIYDGKNYAGVEVIKVDPSQKEAVFRGGAFNAELRFCRISNRNHVSADTRNYAIGLRLAE